MIEMFWSGVVLGTSNGVAPGPLSNLIISKTITDGKKQGFYLALAPFISDIFIVSLAYYLVKSSQKLHMLNTLVPFIGAIFISYLAIMGLKASSAHNTELNNYKFKDAVIVNLVNPYPYLFWIFVGIPLVIKSDISVAFFISFYTFFILTKLAIIFFVDAGLKNKTLKVKQRINKLLSLSLFYFTYKLIAMGINNI